MNKEFIPYEQALELKELGFNEKCMAMYHLNKIDGITESELILKEANTNISDVFTRSPLYQQAFRWFREKHNLLYTIEETLEDDEVWYEWTIKTSNGFEGSAEPTYEEAELACLKKLIEIVKNK